MCSHSLDTIMANRIGVLSDTHLSTCSAPFSRLVDLVFRDCNIIIHAGDITDIRVLDAFSDKTLYAVHGNMCSRSVKECFPESVRFTIDGHSIAVCHGAGIRESIEDRLYDRFSHADCIVYGHTHEAAQHRYGKTLFINPGSFAGTGRFGRPGTYAILESSKNGLSATIHPLPQPK